MQIIPSYERLLVLPDQPTQQSDSLFEIPTAFLSRPTTGMVVSVGEGCHVQPGQRIMYGFLSGKKVVMRDTEYILMKWHDVFGVIEEDNIPLHNCCYVKLPAESNTDVRTSASGLDIKTLSELKYLPTHGTVLAIGPECKNIAVGDEVFFGNDTFDAAKERAFGSTDTRATPIYKPIRNFAIKQNGEWYLMLCEWDAYCVKRGSEIITLNNYIIAKPIPKEQVKTTESGFEVLDLSPEEYRQNQFEVVATNKDSAYQNGDVILTLKHCDLLLEQVLNTPILDGKHFFVENENIIGKIEAKSFDKSMTFNVL